MAVETKSDPLRVAVVEDVRDSREALVFLINHEPDMICAAAVASAEEALEKLPAAQPQLILLDIQLAGAMNGVDCLARLKGLLPSAQVIMLTGNNHSDTVVSCLMRGAIGYLHKSQPSERMPDALREAAAGGSPMSPEIARLVTAFFQRLSPATQEWDALTPREQDVLRLLAHGFLKKEIADQLAISEETVRTHCRHIYEKLHVNCREHAVAKVMPFELMSTMNPTITSSVQSN